MRNGDSLRQISGPSLSRMNIGAVRFPRHFLLGVILILALLAFEAFNFDTTRYALQNLMGDVRFAGVAWATILAIAFCAIDFAGLGRLLTPERGRDEPKEIWYLTGAWLLGATMNAVMTWWAVSTVLLGHDLGNEILSREQLLHIVPVFVAILVWLTRILFIGAVTMAGERLLHGEDEPAKEAVSVPAASQSGTSHYQPAYATQRSSAPSQPSRAPVGAAPTSAAPVRQKESVQTSSRPPRPGRGATRHQSYAGMRTSKAKAR